ncbi:MAG: hypothetical protein J1D77_02615 [Muribaculaceae bacterium]|nr:hypothetical protein [Muribaculaceae bacterium]
MKKLLRNLLCGGTLAAMAMSANTANAADDNLYVVGDYVNGESCWNFDDSSRKMTYNSSSNTYTWTGETLGNNFKLATSNWSTYNLGSNGGKLSLSTAYSPAKGGQSNIQFAQDGICYSPTITYNVSANTITITGTMKTLPTESEMFGEYVYVIGDFNNSWALNTDYALPKTSNGVYSGTISIPEMTSNYFRIFSSIEYGFNSYTYGPSANTKVNTSSTYSGTATYNSSGSWYLENWPGGTLEITFTASTRAISIKMTEGTVYPEVAYLPGNFNSWAQTPEAYKMTSTEQNPGIFSGTFTIPATVDYNGETGLWPQFKVYNGFAWVGTADSTTQDSGGKGDLAVTLQDGVEKVLNTSTSSDAANWVLEDWNGGDITFTYDYDKKTLTLLWEDKPVVPEELYFVGDVYAYNNGLGASWDSTSPYAFTNNNDGTFTIKGVELKNGGTSYFNFITATGTWTDLEAGEPFRYGPETDDATANAVTVGTSVDMTLLAASTGNSWNIADGVYDFTVNFNTKIPTFTATASQTEPFIPAITIPSALYLIGNLASTEGEWVLDESPQFTLTQTGVFIMNKVEFVAVDDNDLAFFGLANIQTETNDEEAWKEINNLHRYGPATANEEVALSPETNKLNWSTNNSWAIDPGVYNLVADFNTLTLSIEAVTEGGDDQTPDEEDGAVALYLRGTFNNWGATDDYLLKNSEEAPEIYTGTFYIPMDDDVQFKIADATWGTNNYGAESVEAGQIAIYSDQLYTTTLKDNGSNLTITNWGGGNLVITFDLDTLKLTVEGPDQTGIAGFGSALNGDESIYNLQGVRVDSNRMTRGLYIINGKKVMVK